MSSRPQLNPQAVITNGNMASASITSLVTIIQKISYVSYAVSWSGTSPVGVFTVQASNDYTQDGSGVVLNAGTWTDVPLSSAAAVSGNTGNGVIDLDGISVYAIRLVYTKTSGTGTAQATITGKVS